MALPPPNHRNQSCLPSFRSEIDQAEQNNSLYLRNNFKLPSRSLNQKKSRLPSLGSESDNKPRITAITSPCSPFPFDHNDNVKASQRNLNQNDPEPELENRSAYGGIPNRNNSPENQSPCQQIPLTKKLSKCSTPPQNLLSVRKCPQVADQARLDAIRRVCWRKVQGRLSGGS